MRIIGLDVGEKRIGVAKADSTIRIASPVGFFNVDGSEWAMIERIARMNNTNVFVIGLPRSNEGNETKQSLYVRQFAKRLVEKIPDAKVRFQDESLTSVQAEERLKMRKKAYEKGDIDAEAATIILQDFVEHAKETSMASSASNQPVMEGSVAPAPKPVAPKPVASKPVASKPVAPAAPAPVAKPVAAAKTAPEAPSAPAEVSEEPSEVAEKTPAAPTEEPQETAEPAKEESAEPENKPEDEKPEEETVAEENSSSTKSVKDAVKATATQVKEGAEKIADSTKGFAKREGNKVALGAKKTAEQVKTFSKKWLIIPPVAIVVILLGITAVLKIRDHIRWERQEYYRQQEEMMKASTMDVTIAPGENIFDVKRRLSRLTCHKNPENKEEESPCYTIEEVEEALKADYGKSFIPSGASLEGMLLGDTYNFYESATPKEIIQKYVDAMEEFITANDLVTKYSNQGLTIYQGIVLASVVQKEARKADMPTVAQVFLTRYSSGIPLGSDVTVTYALDVEDPNRVNYPDNQSALQIDSCYNTRKYAGLPCGPISMPSKDALLAVANPSDTSYLYFLTGDDGVMYYSYTEYEHNRNAYLHCQELCNVSL